MSLSLAKQEYYLNSSLFKETNSVKILNPLSNELNNLRQTLLFSGLEAIEYNQNRKRSNLKLYEFGKIYSYDATKEGLKKYNEKFMLSLFLTGLKYSETYKEKSAEVTIFSLKSFVEILLKKSGLKFQTAENTNPELGLGISYLVNNKVVANILGVHKNILKNFDIKQSVFYAEIDWIQIMNYCNKNKVEFSELPKFPEVKRDLALLVNNNTKYSDLEVVAYKTEKRILKNVNLFDVYEGNNLEEGKKSYGLSFTLRDDNGTLNDKQIETTMKKIQEAFEKDFGAVLR
jgi:phenylalanyl-tRNA synthetase beta chain